MTEKPISFDDFTNTLWQTMLSFLGELTTSEARIWPIRNFWNPKTQRGVLKTSHNSIEHLRTALCLITMIGENNASVHVVGVTGTLKSARSKYLGMSQLGAF
jgi:ribonuclease P/MRP protein subunit POP5